METKTCTSCGETKPIDRFRHHGWRADGSSRKKAICRPCDNKQKKRNEKRRIVMNNGENTPIDKLLSSMASQLEQRSSSRFELIYGEYDREILRYAAESLRGYAKVVRERE
jgi:hypothetical protein